jgi:hypothetical protein
MTTVARSGIDDVLRQAIDNGAVPNVAAIAADRHGIIYEGGRKLQVDPEVGGRAGRGSGALIERQRRRDRRPRGGRKPNRRHRDGQFSDDPSRYPG